MIEQKVKAWEWVVYGSLIIFGALLIVISTIENVRLLLQNWQIYGSPFGCHCDAMWNTCECSEARMTASGYNCSSL